MGGGWRRETPLITEDAHSPLMGPQKKSLCFAHPRTAPLAKLEPSAESLKSLSTVREVSVGISSSYELLGWGYLEALKSFLKIILFKKGGFTHCSLKHSGSRTRRSTDLPEATRNPWEKLGGGGMPSVVQRSPGITAALYRKFFFGALCIVSSTSSPSAS